MVRLMPLHHVLLYENPEWFNLLTFLVPAYTSCPRKEAVE